MLGIRFVVRRQCGLGREKENVKKDAESKLGYYSDRLNTTEGF